MHSATSMALGADLIAAVGESQVFAGADIDPRYHSDRRRRSLPPPAFVVRPADTAEVAAVVAAARRHRVPIVPQGGRTGLVGGAVPEPDDVVLSLERLNRVVEVDPASMTMTVEAGCVLQVAQQAAEAEGLFVPLDLGARGSATVGGNISTNAGGVRVQRFGMTRDMVLGLEAVLADGSVVSSLSKTIKDNAGYDWKQLLIGSEGTLGIVTKAVLRLRPAPRSTATAFLALSGFDQAIPLLRRLQADTAGALTSYELMWSDFYELVTRSNRTKRAPPLPEGSPLYALIEVLGADPVNDAERFQDMLAGILSDGLASDAVVAQSVADAERMWAVREDLDDGFRPIRPFFVFDVSVSIADMAAFVALARNNVVARYPDARLATYGHIGDGNLHLVVGVGTADVEAHHAVNVAVYDAVQRFRGSISAEHGIGTAKRDYLAYSRSPAEIALMRTIKTALDPDDILNPGKLLPPAQA